MLSYIMSNMKNHSDAMSEMMAFLKKTSAVRAQPEYYKAGNKSIWKVCVTQKQSAIKIIMNGEYGASGMRTFTYFDPYVAATVTWCGRTLILGARALYANFM